MGALGRSSGSGVTATIASGSTVATTPYSSATRTSVGDAASDTQILAANSSRRFASVYNDSTAILYLGLGTTAASTSSYTVQMPQGAYYEVPEGFTGEIRGIWASDAGGNARVTEVT